MNGFSKAFIVIKVWAEDWSYRSHTWHSTMASVVTISAWHQIPLMVSQCLIVLHSTNTALLLIVVIPTNLIVMPLHCYDLAPRYKLVTRFILASMLLTSPQCVIYTWVWNAHFAGLDARIVRNKYTHYCFNIGIRTGVGRLWGLQSPPPQHVIKKQGTSFVVATFMSVKWCCRSSLQTSLEACYCSSIFLDSINSNY